jgi:hypothetical protein
LQGKNPFLGDNGLYALFKDAYKQYKAETSCGRKLYERFKADFINSHRHPLCPCPYGMNSHEKNYGIIKDILERRKDLVEKYWNKGSFDRDDFLEMKREFDTTVYPPTNTEITRNIPQPRFAAFECGLSDMQMSLIAECANEAHLFCTHVDKEDMKALLHCHPGFSLYANKLNHVAKLFDRLSFYRLICHKWQSVISENKLLFSAKTGQPINSSNLSSALSQLNKRNSAIADYIDQMVKKVKDMKTTEEKTNK